jgi:uncharacterized protein YkwD
VVDAWSSDAPGTVEPDAWVDPLCAGGDGVCLESCIATDPDCVPACGDGYCVANAGELCGNCPADCATTTPVCGNAACEPGEAPDCYADCGPTPWTWQSDENALLALVNDARTSGVACPEQKGVVRPALALSDNLRFAAREWAWEIAHHDHFSANACNGRTYNERRTAGGFNSYTITQNGASVQSVFDSWMTNKPVCEMLMSPSHTIAAIGIAIDTKTGYVVVLK